MDKLNELNKNSAQARKILEVNKKEYNYFKEQREYEEDKKKEQTNYNQKKNIDIYTEEKFNEKVTRDFYIFEALTKKSLDELNNKKTNDIITEEITKLYQIVRYLYEEVNIKPISILRVDLRESQNDISENAHNIVVEFLQSKYYNLSKKTRLEYYLKENRENVLENIENEELNEDNLELEIHKSQKKILFDIFIESIIFPKNKRLQLEHEIKSSKEHEIYDTSILENALKNYDIVKGHISEMLSMLI